MATNVNLLDRAPNIVFRALSAVLAEDVSGLDRPLWRDVSRYQGQMDYSVSAANGVMGVAARSTISWGYQDPWFPHNWDESVKYNLYRTSYHVLYPGEDVFAQAHNWYRVHPELDVIPRIIDMELQHNQPYQRIADAMWDLSNIVVMRDGVRPIIYSRYSLVNTWLASWTAEMLNDHKWWLAQYLWDRAREHPGPPTIPDRIDAENIILHQTADKKLDFPGEAESYAIDWDRWCQGDTHNMYEQITEWWGTPETPLTLEERVAYLESLHDIYRGEAYG